MANEFRLDNASSLSSTNALLVALPSNAWWTTRHGLPPRPSTKPLNAGAVAGSKEETSDSQWTGTWLFSMPATPPPAGTVTVRAFITPAPGAQWSGGVLQVAGTSDYWVNLPTAAGEQINITTETTVINN